MPSGFPTRYITTVFLKARRCAFTQKILAAAFLIYPPQVDSHNVFKKFPWRLKERHASYNDLYRHGPTEIWPAQDIWPRNK